MRVNLSFLLFISGLGSVQASTSFGPGRQAVKQFKHPGSLHTQGDLDRIRGHVEKGDEPWSKAFAHLSANSLAQPTREPNPKTVIVRGKVDGLTENYPSAYRDAHSAYQLALRWIITGNTTFATAAVGVLDAWASTLEGIDGGSDKFLAAGLYGYQFANAGELLRSFSGWPAKSQSAFGAMLKNVFAPMNRDFLDHHNGIPDHYYANWYLCNIASLMAIGTFVDNSTMYNYAVEYFKNGPADGAVANGALPFFSIANFTEETSGKPLMQGQEAGRDQGHALLCFALLGVIGQQGYNQGVDLFNLFGNQILNGAEYAAKYNTGHSVPFKPYNTYEGVRNEISDAQRYNIRPGFEAIYSHYAELKGLDASWSKAYRDMVNGNSTENIEGGGGDFGPNSGGFDVFGHGTLLYRLKA
ncbi:GPI anchored protein-like protein [Aaosphaeria arxii CBS 175.79]|uniref:GPI anchored protein-like protein n=1 Tax=Aaosphaeria arxii CBS 175.79 TaxID=1450172 RepID=A0A6A5YBC4_9PLEO|nr:GPI anchored protein-like protein [Aaosphaeria arxii CBS 175.79]KAF2022030.1 GPI anchored protein-like protein [Aaosphaeria arxii CBS 175.79]